MLEASGKAGAQDLSVKKSQLEELVEPLQAALKELPTILQV